MNEELLRDILIELREIREMLEFLRPLSRRRTGVVYEEVIIDCLREESPLSVSELVRRTGFARQTIYNKLRILEIKGRVKVKKMRRERYVFLP